MRDIFEKFWFASNTNELVSQLNDYRMLEIEIKYLTGYDIRGLRDFLAGGYTLEPPKRENLSFAKMAGSEEEGD